MKKKVIIGIVVGVILLLSVLDVINIIRRANNIPKTNKSFGEYNGVYIYKNNMFKILHNENKIYYKIYNKTNELIGSSDEFIEGNTLKTDEYKFIFHKNSFDLKSSIDSIPSGQYKKINGYLTNDIYKDYVGDLFYYGNEYTGMFTKDGLTIYTVQISEKEVRIYYENEFESFGTILEKKENNHFYTEFFEDKYDIVFQTSSFDLMVESDDQNKKSISGHYKRGQEGLSKVDVIKFVLK